MLQNEIQKVVADAEQKLMQRRKEMLPPILELLQNKIDKVAKDNGYTYILNESSSSGVTNILFGAEEHNITEKLMIERGLQN